MTSRIAWLLDTNVVSEMMRPNPEPRIAGFLDSIAGEGIGLASRAFFLRAFGELAETLMRMAGARLVPPPPPAPTAARLPRAGPSPS